MGGKEQVYKVKGHEEVIQSGGRGLFRVMEYAHDEFVYVSTFLY